MDYTIFLEEILDQPAALRGLISAYGGTSSRVSDAYQQYCALQQPLVFVGMGASYHAGLIAAQHLRMQGKDARAIEATDLLFGVLPPPDANAVLVYISQSGSSGEVIPLLDRYGDHYPTVAITNTPNSPLGTRANLLLPVLAGSETTVASKTYLNSLALAAQLAPKSLNSVAERIAQIITARGEIEAQFMYVLPTTRTTALYFLGHGAAAYSARQAAMMMHEWAKFPAHSSTIGAFRHGPIEVVQPGIGFVIFASSADGQAQPNPMITESIQVLQRELESYGGHVLVLQSGAFDTDAASHNLTDIPQAAMLDAVTMQIAVEAYTRARGVPPGFRHIQKVTTRL